MSHKVFVYGTLKKNEPNHHWLTNKDNGVGKFIANGRTKTKYPLIIATRYNVPFILFKPGTGHNINGEIYGVDEKMLSQLDVLEGHPEYYVRELDDIVVEGEKDAVQCWVYFLKTFRNELLGFTMMDTYSSNGDHGKQYMERSKRDPNYNSRVDLR